MLRCTLGMDVDIDRSTGRAADGTWMTWWRGSAGIQSTNHDSISQYPLSVAFLIGSLVIAGQSEACITRADGVLSQRIVVQSVATPLSQPPQSLPSQ